MYNIACNSKVYGSPHVYYHFYLICFAIGGMLFKRVIIELKDTIKVQFFDIFSRSYYTKFTNNVLVLLSYQYVVKFSLKSADPIVDNDT